MDWKVGGKQQSLFQPRPSQNEDLAQGERVREFIIEGKTAVGWQEIFKGSCIGHKFIHRFDELKVDALRLKISESIGKLQIKKFEVFKVEE